MAALYRGTAAGHPKENYALLFNDVAAAYALALDWRLSGGGPMAAMSCTHREIFALGIRLTHLIETMLPVVKANAETIADLQRVLYSLDAILRLHFAQEEEVYQGLC